MKHLFGILFNSKSLVVLMVALMLPLSLNLAEAGNPKCPGDHQSCKDDGGSDLSYVTSPADNWAFWDGGNYIWEETPNSDLIARYCGNGDPADPNPQGYVAYICHESAYGDWPMKNTVHIKLDPDWRVGTPEGPGDDDLTADDLCKLAEGNSTGGALVMNLPTSESVSYYYGMDPTWNEGPCIDPDDPDTCLVLFATQGYFDHRPHHPEHCSDRKCGRRVQLAGWGQANPAPEFGDNIYEYNPFVCNQDIPIDDMTVTFRAVGKNKVAARCHYHYEPPQGEEAEVIFRILANRNCEE